MFAVICVVSLYADTQLVTKDYYDNLPFIKSLLQVVVYWWCHDLLCHSTVSDMASPNLIVILIQAYLIS